MKRAEADVGLAVANRYPDVYVLYQPYTFQDDRSSASRCPLLGRRRVGPAAGLQPEPGEHPAGPAERLADPDRAVALEQQVDLRGPPGRAAIRRDPRGRRADRASLLPNARVEHDRANRLYVAGELDELTFLTAERDFDQVVRQYRDTLVRHRRAMLKLNTAVGVRILP